MSHLRISYCLLVVIILALAITPLQASSTVQAAADGNNLTLSNNAIAANWSIRDGKLRWKSLSNRFTGATLSLNGSVFELVPREGPVLGSPEFKMVGSPVLEDLPVSASSPKAADHLPGRQIRVELEDPSANVRVTWKVILREGANYVRQEVTIRAGQQPFALTQIGLVDLVAPAASVSGHVKGSPVTAGAGSSPIWFFGFEHPLSDCRVRAERAACWLSRELPLQAGQSVTYSAVFGVVRAGQLRRDFLNYVELERAHPYRTFLHYNSWYDLGYFDRYNEQGALAVVQNFGEQLTRQRGVKLDSFLFDDGWDDPTTLWKFNPGFPDGLTKVAQTAASFGAAPGILAFSLGRLR